MEYLIFFILGLAGGLVSGLLGIGGVIMLPLLFYFTNIETRAATAIAMIQIFSGALFCTVFNCIQKNINFRYAVTFGLSSMAFSFLGSFFTKYFSGTDIKIIYLFSVIVAVILFFLKKKKKDEGIIFNKKIVFMIIPIGAVTGFIGGIIGLGSGYLYVPILIIFFNFPINLAIGTSLVVVLFNAVPGIIGKLLSVDFNILLGLVIAAGSIAGSRFGTYLCKRIKPKIIRIIFLALLLIIIVAVSVDLYLSFT